VGSRGFAVAEARLRRLAQRVDELRFRLDRLADSRALTVSRRRRIEAAEAALVHAVGERMNRWQSAFTRAAHTLDALSPLRVLDRGYAVCLGPGGAVVRSAGEVVVGAEVRVRLRQGAIAARVTGREDDAAG
jgi:exodeoxyribonuclease VII large subunit